MLSLPIRHPEALTTYADIQAVGGSIGKLVENLTQGSVKATDRAHVDPDLRPESLPRLDGWRPLFGQVNQAQGHLANQRVGVGDVFLFFGWFKDVQERDGRYEFRPGAPDLHVLFGWLEVGDVWRGRTGPCEAPQWASSHPHVAAMPGRRANTIYVASDGNLPHGGGVFPKRHEDLVLTAPSAPRATWRLPEWFCAGGKRPKLTYHPGQTNWAVDGEHVLLQSARRGQEFVLDADDYPEAVTWARRLISAHGRPG
jgi:hypothetical protein